MTQMKTYDFDLILNLANTKCVLCTHTLCVCVCVPIYGKSSASFQLPTTFLSSLAKNTGLPLKEEKPLFLIHNGGSLRESKHQSLALLIRASHSGT